MLRYISMQVIVYSTMQCSKYNTLTITRELGVIDLVENLLRERKKALHAK